MMMEEKKKILRKLRGRKKEGEKNHLIWAVGREESRK